MTFIGFSNIISILIFDKGKYMKRRLLILLISIVSILCFSFAFACGDVPLEQSIVSGDFTYQLIDGTRTYKLTKYDGTDTEVTVSDTINGYAVATVGSGAFTGNTIKKLTFEDDIQNFEKDSIDIERLSELTLSKNLTFIHDEAVTTLSKERLSSITLPANAIMAAFPGSSYYMKYCRVTKGEIPDYVFSDQVPSGTGNWNASSLETLIMDDEVTSVGVSICRAMKQLKTLRLSNSLTELKQSSFCYMYSIEEVVLPEGLEKLSSQNFSNCYSLKEVILPASLTTISSSFQNCASLTRLVIPENSNLTDVNSGAFYNSQKLFEIINLSNMNFALGTAHLGYATSHYGKAIFRDINQTCYVKIRDYLCYSNEQTNEHVLVSYLGNEPLLSDLPENINGHNYKINAYAFYNRSISWITIPAAVTEIGVYAFTNPSTPPLKRVIFEDPTGWTAYLPDTENSEKQVSVADDNKNATYFISTYVKYNWIKAQ